MESASRRSQPPPTRSCRAKQAALAALGLGLVVVAVSGCAGQPEQAQAPAQTISADRAAVTAPARTAPATRSPARSRAAGTADTIVRVTDGDTIVLAGLGRTRLIGIDTPEVYFRRECYGQEASSFTKRLLPPGTRVRYRFDVERRDRYGRALAYVWKGRMFVNAELARRGYAVTLTIPPNVRYAERFRALAALARDHERGLWSPSTCAGDADRPSEQRATTAAPKPVPARRPRTPPVTATTATPGGCDPSYAGACLDAAAADYDCAGGSGDGPEYTGEVRVVGEDDFDLDRNGDRVACSPRDEAAAPAQPASARAGARRRRAPSTRCGGARTTRRRGAGRGVPGPLRRAQDPVGRHVLRVEVPLCRRPAANRADPGLGRGGLA